MRFPGFRILSAVLPALLLLSFSSARAGQLRVLHSDETSLEVLWTMEEPALEFVALRDGLAQRPFVEGGLYLADPGEPDLPMLLNLLALPGKSLPRVEVVAVSTGELAVSGLAAAPRPVVGRKDEPTPGPHEVREPLARGSGVSPAQWAECFGVSRQRSQYVTRLGIHPVRWDASRNTLIWAQSLRLRLVYDESDRAAGHSARVRPEHQDWMELQAASLLNANVATRWGIAEAPVARGGGTDSFESSPNWVRFPIATTGVYRLDYFTFSNLGVDPGGIDPRTIRVFAGTNLPLEEDLLASPPPAFMTECGLKSLGNGDGVFDLSDRFLFWAHAPFGWANEFDPNRSRFDYVENEYGDISYYWVTWGGSFGAPPQRMATRSVVDTTFSGGAFPTSSPHRRHYEQNNAEEFAYRDEDGWMWEDLRGRGDNRLYRLSVPNPASGDGIVAARLYSHRATGRDVRRVELKLQDQITTTWQWLHGAFSAAFDVTGCFEGLLLNGNNEVRVNADFDDGESIDHIFTGWFDVEYDRRLVADKGRFLHFYSDPDSLVLPTAPAGSIPCTALPAGLVYGQSAFRLTGFDAAPNEIHLFDVTDQHKVVELTDVNFLNPTPPYDLRFSDPGMTGVRWYAAVTLDGVRALPAGEIPDLKGLRRTSNKGTYLIIYHEKFREGAERLAELRSRDFATLTVDADDVYQEFSWGMRDPVAIRDFLAAANTRWTSSPLYVVLLGDAAYDTKGNLSGSPTDYLSTYTRRYREANVEFEDSENIDFYSTDDFFGYLDADDFNPLNQPSLDVAIGRMPFSDVDVLDLCLDKLEAYANRTMPGQWQNRVILVADDERTLEDSVRERFHTEQVETLSRERFPAALDRVKIYLVDFPRNEFGKKPQAQQKFIEEFTRGALMTTYTGHGDQNTMAQEEVFVSQKIGELLNEERYTIFSTFSCTVSRFDLLSGSSMTELLLEHEDGGAVTTFASGGLVFPSPSSALNQRWLGSMFGTPYLIPTPSRGTRPIGLAAVQSKVEVSTSSGVRKNSEKYVLLGDPALEVRFGEQLADFEVNTVATETTDGELRLIRGQLRDFDGNILDGTTPGVPAFSGKAFVHVTEDADTTGYDYLTFGGAPAHIDFTLDGSTAFRGEVPVVNGRYEVRFFLSEGVRTGNNGRISVFALEEGGGVRAASGAYESLALGPTISESLDTDREGPRIVIRFENYGRIVDGDQIFTDTPILNIEVSDATGVNLRPFPQFARLEADIDGQRYDLAADFSYVEGSYTTGKVRRIVSLAPGDHVLKVKAFDNAGNRGDAEVEFTIVLDSAGFDIVDNNVAAYPNPFRGRVDFVFALTHDADVALKVFTITGRKLYEAPTLAAARGENVVSWNGQDENGNPLANGTYLFKLEATYLGDEERGRQTDEFVGTVVRMR